MATTCQKTPTFNTYHLYRCHVSTCISKPGIRKPRDRERLHTIMCMYACLSADIMKKSGILMQLCTIIYPHPGCKGKERGKAKIPTYFKAQKPWQGNLLLAATDFWKYTSSNTPKLSWLQERNKVASPPNPWERLPQLNLPCLHRPEYYFSTKNPTKTLSVLETVYT